MYIVQRRVRRHELPDRKHVHRILRRDQGWQRRDVLLHQWWHRRWDYWIMHVYVM